MSSTYALSEMFHIGEKNSFFAIISPFSVTTRPYILPIFLLSHYVDKCSNFVDNFPELRNL
jgi:hypothetical protein